jgi:hypothetical protein
MASGGSRKGAGRKPSLTVWERVIVGQKCESLFLEELQKSKYSAIKTATFHVADEHEEAKKLSLSERKARNTQESARHSYSVDLAVQEDQKTGDAPAGRMRRLNPKRPYGVRIKILAEIANEFSVSEGTVDKCWKECRKKL